MKTYDIKRINNNSFNAESFNVFFLRYIQRDDIDLEKSLDVLKISGVYAGRFSVQPDKDYNTYFKSCINALLGKYPGNKKQIVDFEKQCKMMHDINNSFFVAMPKRNIWSKNKTLSNNSCLSFILFSEVFLSTVSAVSLKVDLLNIKKISHSLSYP